MGVQVIYVFTHDSVFLGEDGPTHQPIEQLPSLRLIPGLEVWRPADALETAMAWSRALARSASPTALILTRQKLAPIERGASFDRSAVTRGGYVLDEAEGGLPEVVLVATGSEVALARDARKALQSAGVRARVVSMPCVEAFREQPLPYRESILPRSAKRVALEAARTEDWCELLGEDCLRIGMTRFGASAPLEPLAQHFGFTPAAVTERVMRFLGRA
jgi:transketolase